MPGQEKGYKTKTKFFRESSIKSPLANKGWLVPINENGVKAKSNLNKPGTTPSNRDANAPYEDPPTVGGPFKVPVDAHNFGHYLWALFDDPVSTVVAAKALGNGAAVDKGSGKVGLPCPGHGLAAGAPVIIEGTTHYDGAYVLQRETSTDEIVVLATYAAETVSSADTCTLARRVTLSAGAARNVASGLVGLPALGHGLPVGAEITVAGTVNYDGAHIVRRGASANEIVISATYVSETMDGSETATARFYDHVYTVGDEMPSFALERSFPTIGKFVQAVGARFGTFSVDIGGTGELTASMDVSACREDKDNPSLDETPAEFPFQRFQKVQATVREGGVTRQGRVTALAVQLGFDLETDLQTCDGDGVNPGTGELGDINPGVLEVKGSLTALLTDATLMDRAELGTVAPIEVFMINGGYRLFLEFQETRLSRNTPDTMDAKGVKETYDWMGWRGTGSNQSSVKATLRNEIKSWEE